MTLKQKFKNLFQGMYSVKDVIEYYIAIYRNQYYNTKFQWLIRKHIREQIDYRISVMKKECYINGECTECGCETPALQMTNKPCKGNCYPSMMNRKNWKAFNNYIYITDYKTKITWKKSRIKGLIIKKDLK